MYICIKAIKFEKDKNGNAKSVTIDLKKHGNDRALEDYLDNIAADEAEKGPFYNYEEAMQKIREKRGVKE